MDLLAETEVQCPWCGEVYTTTVDTTQGDHVAVEDCVVCCRPLQLSVTCEPGDLVGIEVERS